jgi:glycosyltransferase involved in cell wall biosynthesis
MYQNHTIAVVVPAYNEEVLIARASARVAKTSRYR